MAENLILKVITPSGISFEEQVETVVLKGETGEFGVLYGHVQMVSKLVPGAVRYVNPDGGGSFIVHGGVSEIKDNVVTVLTAAVEKPDESVVSVSLKEAEEIERKLESGSVSEEERARLSENLQLARARAGM